MCDAPESISATAGILLSPTFKVALTVIVRAFARGRVSPALLGVQDCCRVAGHIVKFCMRWPPEPQQKHSPAVRRRILSLSALKEAFMWSTSIPSTSVLTLECWGILEVEPLAMSALGPITRVGLWVNCLHGSCWKGPEVLLPPPKFAVVESSNRKCGGKALLNPRRRAFRSASLL